ncbi:MAG: carbamoyltransferase HypF [Candidatus Thiodiazotropha sp.]
MIGESIRIRGIVQGVGMRPTLWRLARDCGLRGEVWNDAEGVLLTAWGDAAALDTFIERLQSEAPPLARIQAVERARLSEGSPPEAFNIRSSHDGETRTGVAADAATCPECRAEVLDPGDRRYRYPFTNCTHCGPRLSIIHAVPYDRANTSMSVFPMCPACEAEYRDPANRRFHAQPNACPECGPRVWLEDAQGQTPPCEPDEDAIAAAARLIREGRILAIKGIGGFHLACDAGNSEAVDRLRHNKRRYHKAFALMARDPEMVQRYVRLSPGEAELLQDRAGPIVILPADGESLPGGIAPGQNSLGFMLPYTPLHQLLMQSMTRPIVLTSGNRSDEPQCTGNDEARERLAEIAEVWLLHDREIVNRLDDSVVRYAASAPRLLRRARGYAPQPIPLGDGFKDLPPTLAMGGELKNSFCLLRDGEAIVSQHMGDLEDAATYRDYRHNLELYRDLFDFTPQRIVVDKHPNYLSTQLGREMAEALQVPLIEVQHHHAHIVSCMAEHGIPRDQRVLGIALDGLGMGEDGELWGGEFLLAGYTGYEKLAGFQSVPMPGGAMAMREPWRNTLAHLLQLPDSESLMQDYADLEIIRFLRQKPLDTLQAMIRKGLNSPPASSAGRLFDAVAAALGYCREQAGFEGHAAIELEAAAEPHMSQERDSAYDHHWRDGTIDWAPMWRALLADVLAGTAAGRIAARFHQCVANAVCHVGRDLAESHDIGTLVLSGGVWQNRLLLEAVSEQFQAFDLKVLAPSAVPANDGGLSLGQAVMGALG